ncbi:MAG: DNA mismatch repair protein MutS, partial [Myxococcaceae bacterium]
MPTPPESSSPHRTYTDRRAAAQADLTVLDRISARYANLRTVAFVVAAGIALLTLLGRLPKPWWWAAAGALVVYGLLAVLHHQVFLKEQRARHFVLLNERGLARL